ncbi:FAD-dependent oxidoreductase [Vibrio sp. T187]|uniref:FAD-dependent oxidoreductase n=1 Tax=Vibrio TaxID=662 RepID=UPI0010CA0C12|nr:MULTISPECIES: FAD-dependent oxidoreductase [Vibrio]MBW3696267.1 FAD-dependent oxidoreductase [Vibrio sp. T187]
MTTKQTDKIQPSIAIIGGGIAGSTAAIHFSELGYQVTLLEKGPSLVNGPPICHLHAGGNLYRDISEQQCLELLRQSIDTVRLFPHSLNIRPTIIAVPHSDSGSPQELLPRLKIITDAYRHLIAQDARNQVLGSPEEYYKLYDKLDLLNLATRSQPKQPKTLDDWCIPFAKHTDLETLKYPVVMVQEYGLSVFRLSATAQLALEQLPNCQVLTHSKLISVSQERGQWQLQYRNQQNQLEELTCDYLINASGFETGIVDDIVGSQQQRLVEFKAAYVTQWPENNDEWPEVIFHGPRGTPQGMAQLTPYADGYFQLHGMTEGITLFEDGLVASCDVSSQPKLPQRLIKKIVSGWTTEQLEERTNAAIQHMAQFVPQFEMAKVGGKPLFGAQQIPGSDPSLRAADVSFCGERYARIEMVKASSALEAASKIRHQWFEMPEKPSEYDLDDIEVTHSVTMSLELSEVEDLAISLTDDRGYPNALAKVSGQPHSL